MCKNKLIAGLMIFLWMCFSGCTQTIPLSDRAIVKAVFAEETNGNYEVAMVIAEETDEESEQKILLKWGKGETVAQAVYQIETSSRKTMFYSQNQLLLIGKNASKSHFLETLAYFGTEQASRPNMAVYATELTCKQFKDWAKSEDFFQNINNLEKGLEKSPKTGRMIYELNTTKDNFNGIVPFLKLTKQGVETTQMVLYQNNQPKTMLKEDSAQITRLLLGMQTKLKFSQEYDKERIQYSMDDAHIVRTVTQTEQGPVLELQLYGVVRGVTASDANQQAELTLWKNRKELSKVISQEITKKMQQTIALTWNQDNDPFHFVWWFHLWHRQKTDQLIENRRLWEYPSIVATAKIKVV